MATVTNPYGYSQGPGPAGIFFLLAGTSFIGAAIGFLGFSFPVILLIGAIVALALLAVRTDVLLALAIVLAFVVAGVVRYFAATNAVANAAPALLILLIFKAVFEHRGTAEPSTAALRGTDSQAPLLYAFGFFLIIVVVSAFRHSITSLALIFALKTYLPLAGVLVMAFVSCAFRRSMFKLWNLLLAIAVIQLPFIVYQHFFVASTRVAQAQGPAWDSVVGTMGGNPDGGGSSGALAIFLSLCLIHLINLIRLRLLRFGRGAALGLLIFAGIALAEVKIVFLLLPIGMAGIFWSELRREPAKAFLILSLGVVATLAVILIYQHVFWQSSSLLGSDIGYNLSRSLDYMLDPNYFHAITGEVGRLAGLLLWWKDAWNDPLAAAFGHGPGASRLNNLFIGDVARRYLPFSVDSTALVALLWDFGVVGAGAYFAMFLAGIRAGKQRLRKIAPAGEIACIHTAVVGIVFLALSAIYNKDILYLPQMSLLLGLCLATAIRCGTTGPATAVK